MPMSGRLRLLILELKHEWEELETRIEAANIELQRIAKQDDACHRLMDIPGFGPLVSTALVAAIGNGITFRKGRDLAAWLGLVPRQHSTGGKIKLLVSASEVTNICDACSCMELDRWWRRLGEVPRRSDRGSWNYRDGLIEMLPSSL
ncbi:MAG: transposase [Acidobacteriaceae bacterium]